MTGYLYLSSPYTHDDEKVRLYRYEKALETLAELTKYGYIVFSPIVHSHPMAEKYDMPKDSTYWSTVNRTFVYSCSALVVLCIEGWSKSSGVSEEVEQAERENKEIFYIKEAKDLLTAVSDRIPEGVPT